jgi:hypothetical protein
MLPFISSDMRKRLVRVKVPRLHPLNIMKKSSTEDEYGALVE